MERVFLCCSTEENGVKIFNCSGKMIYTRNAARQKVGMERVICHNNTTTPYFYTCLYLLVDK